MPEADKKALMDEWTNKLLVKHVADGDEVALGLGVDVESHLPVLETLLELLEAEVDNLEDVLPRECAL